jgi:DNA-binding Lrp family transcriptional regulator
MELLEKEKVIFEHLFYDARRSTHKLAKILNMKQPSIHAKIKKLERVGFINRYDSLIMTNALPLIYKMYYASLETKQIKEIQKHVSCFGLQEIFGEYSHQIFAFFKSEDQVQEFENKLPKKHIKQLLTKSHRLGGSLFDINREVENYAPTNSLSKLDKLDVKLIRLMLNGGARTTTVDLAKKLKTTCAIAKYRKKRLIDNGYFLYFVSQPGAAFKSIKIAYHVFFFDEAVDTNLIKSMPRCIIAYSGDKCLTVIQASLSFDDYLEHSNNLIKKLRTHITHMQSFIVNKPIILNRLSDELFEE